MQDMRCIGASVTCIQCLMLVPAAPCAGCTASRGAPAGGCCCRPLRRGHLARVWAQRRTRARRPRPAALAVRPPGPRRSIIRQVRLMDRLQLSVAMLTSGLKTVPTPWFFDTTGRPVQRHQWSRPGCTASRYPQCPCPGAAPARTTSNLIMTIGGHGRSCSSTADHHVPALQKTSQTGAHPPVAVRRCHDAGLCDACPEGRLPRVQTSSVVVTQLGIGWMRPLC